MRVAVVGQGSIGRRHAGILVELGHEVVAFDPSPTSELPAGVEPSERLHDCLQGADAAIVASPSSEHLADARAAVELGIPVLVEKPLALNAAQAAELDCLARSRNAMLSVAMNLREHPGVQGMAARMAEGATGQILHAGAWCGSWLPDWRANTDYRRSYSARAELGGGVLLDVAVHELDYLLWLVGPARTVSALARQVSDLETDVEDVSLISMELARGGVAQVTVDYFDRSYTRGCRLVGSRGTLHWSWEDERLTHHDADCSTSQYQTPSDASPTYRRQLERFLAAVSDGAQPPVPAGEARHVLEVIDAARRSSRSGRRVALAPPVTLRPVNRGDGQDLLAWRNDPETRRWSRTSHEISSEEHSSWLERVIDDPVTRLWIAESEGKPVGSVRVGPESSGAAEVHITMAPQARGRGLGAAVLTEAAAQSLADPDIQRLYAHVKVDHGASLHAFAQAGFIDSGTVEHGLARLDRGGEAR